MKQIKLILKLRLLVLVLLSLLISLFAEEVNVTGTVQSETNAPVSGAEVHLMKKNITTFTDSIGKFKLSDDFLSIRAGLKQKYVPLVSLHGCIIDVTLTSPSPIKITIYGINGKKIYNIGIGMN